VKERSALETLLTPLSQWICDSCGEIIESADQGWLEWLHDTSLPVTKACMYGFNIVHYKPYSNREGFNGCYKYDKRRQPRYDVMVLGGPLSHYAGARALPAHLMLLDPSPHRQDSFQGPQAKELGEWSELVKRLMLPFYEEARRYVDKAQGDGILRKRRCPQSILLSRSRK